MPRPRDSQGASDRRTEPRPDPARVAELVADGCIPFPSDLDHADAVQLTERVSSIRRLRLLRHIARAIAADIHRDRGP